MAFKLLPEEKVPEPSILSKAARFPSQIAKEGAVTLAGLPGDVFNLINKFAAAPITKAITGHAPQYEETYLSKILPTSSSLRSGVEKEVPYLKPKNEVERFVSDLASDTAALLLPVKTKIPFKKTLTKAFSTSLGANIAGEAVKDLTGDEKKAAYTKMGSLFGLSLLNKPAAAKYVGELYSKAESLLPKGARVNASELEKSMESLKNKVLAGRSQSTLAPSEKFVVDEADKILSMIEQGKIEINTAWAAKRSLNENLQSLYQSLPEKASRGRAKKLASQINGDLRQTIKEYGKKNPEFYKNFSSADEAFGAIAQSNFMSRFMRDHINYSPVTHGLIHALGLTGNVVSGAVPYHGAKILHRIYNSPTLRNYYMNVMEAAAKEDSIVFNKELSRLDKALQREEKEKNYKYRLLD